MTAARASLRTKDRRFQPITRREAAWLSPARSHLRSCSRARCSAKWCIRGRAFPVASRTGSWRPRVARRVTGSPSTCRQPGDCIEVPARASRRCGNSYAPWACRNNPLLGKRLLDSSGRRPKRSRSRRLFRVQKHKQMAPRGFSGSDGGSAFDARNLQHLTSQKPLTLAHSIRQLEMPSQGWGVGVASTSPQTDFQCMG